MFGMGTGVNPAPMTTGKLFAWGPPTCIAAHKPRVRSSAAGRPRQSQCQRALNLVISSSGYLVIDLPIEQCNDQITRRHKWPDFIIQPTEYPANGSLTEPHSRSAIATPYASPSLPPSAMSRPTTTPCSCRVRPRIGWGTGTSVSRTSSTHGATVLRCSITSRVVGETSDFTTPGAGTLRVWSLGKPNRVLPLSRGRCAT